MKPFSRPRLVSSLCLELEPCRYNGVSIRAPFLSRLATHVELVPVCPEVEIGLGVPRDPIRIVSRGGGLALVQPSTGRDLTEAMTGFASGWLREVGAVDGFVLKSRSPSCGIKDVKVHPAGGGPSGDRTAGLFAARVLERFPDAAIEDEGRLTNFRLRHHFLTKLFALAGLREVTRAGGLGALVDYHADYKLLLMGQSQAALRRLGRLVAEGRERGLAETLASYRTELARALTHPPRTGSVINALMHAFGYFKQGLDPREKQQFLDALEELRRGRLPLSGPLVVLRSWVARFEEPYLSRQRLFEPYPRELFDLSDSGAGALSA